MQGTLSASPHTSITIVGDLNLDLLRPTKQGLKTSPTQLRVDDKVITDPKGIANALNRHYTTVFDIILNKQLMAHLTRRSSRKHVYNDSTTSQYSRAAQAQRNKLPERLRNITYKAEFKNELKLYLLSLQQS
eukprot:g51843.t1